MAPAPLPGTIALATDLSHRSDRAMDRAVQLAKAWRARLLIIHAIEERADGTLDTGNSQPSWRRPPNLAEAVRRQIHRDLLREETGLDIDIVVEPGPPAQLVLEKAKAAGAGLIVTGVARQETLGRMILGDTVDKLLRKSEMPLLVVRGRARAPYGQMVVATDFSPSSRIALAKARALFPGLGFTLFHGYDVPFASYLNRAEIDREFEGYGEEAAARLLGEIGLSPDEARAVPRLIERGAPEALLRDYLSASSGILTVVGTHGGGLVYRALIGSTARRIIDMVESDVLVVPTGDDTAR